MDLLTWLGLSLLITGFNYLNDLANVRLLLRTETAVLEPLTFKDSGLLFELMVFIEAFKFWSRFYNIINIFWEG